MKYLKTFEEIINMPSWPSLNDPNKNGYVLPMIIWTYDIFDEIFKNGDYDNFLDRWDPNEGSVKLVKKWNLENGLVGSYFQFKDGHAVIFTHLKEVNLEFCESKKGGNQLPEDFKKRAEILFNKYGLGSPIFCTAVKKFEDGVKVSTTGSNWLLSSKLGIKKLGTSTYKGFVREIGIPLYSDDTQTPESKEFIWKKLLQDKTCEIVGWSQTEKKEVEIEIIDGNPYYKGGVPIYFGDKEINQQVLGSDDLDEDKYKKMKSLTKNLKLKSVK